MTHQSFITHSELYAGSSVWEKNVAREELEILLSGMEILPINIEISKKAGEIRAKCGVDLFDAIIAATAIINNFPLSTKNIKHFEKIKEIKFL